MRGTKEGDPEYEKKREQKKHKQAGEFIVNVFLISIWLSHFFCFTMRETWFVRQIDFKSISGSVEQRAVSGDDDDDDVMKRRWCWWRPNTVTLIIIL